MEKKIKQNVSDFISEMVLMGFEMEECQAAVSAGKLNLEDAVDWVLQDQHQNVVGSQFDSGGILGKIPIVCNFSDSEAYGPPCNLPEIITKGMSYPVMETEMTKNALRNQIEEQARKILTETIRKERIDQKKAHAEVIKKITRDKQERIQKELYTDFANLDDGIVPLIRCPDNLTLKKKFTSRAVLEDVWQFLRLQIVGCEDMELMQLFPRRIFKDENRKQSLAELDLLSSNCLVLKPKILLEAELQGSLTGIKTFSGKVNSRFRRPDETKEDLSNESVYTSEGGCKIQIRCENSRVVRKKFESRETLNDVWCFIKTQSLRHENMELMQAFPRRVFTDEDRYRTLEDLDLLPSTCLILKPLDDPNCIALRGVQSLTIDYNSRIRGSSEIYRELTSSNSEKTDKTVVSSQQIEPIPPEPDLNLVLAYDSHLWGDGKRLGSEANVVQHNQILAGSTAQLRVQNIITPPISERCNCLIWSPTVLTLQDVCIKYVVKQLLEYTTLMLNLPSQVGERILQFLMKEKLLRPRHMQKFLSCHLIHLILDCYPYTTNELLNSVRNHTSLLHVSLVGCTLINDSGLQSLSNLKKLLTLNLRGCVQITDNCFNVISELTHLNSLSLEETKITDLGIMSYTKYPNLALQVLNLNRTAITECCLASLKNVPNLRFLSMDWTKILSLRDFPNFQFLEGLSIQALNIQTEDLQRLRNLTRLSWLNVTDMPNVVGDDALKVLSGLQFHFLSLPSRHTTSDSGLAYILGMPLISLDLTNYINVSDVGISMLSRMKNLRRLLLNNTKLTDNGLLTLKDLHTIEILYLDRTAITDAGTSALIGMPKLQELSLASTRVKGQFLKNGVLNRCLLLTKLNLSRTMIKMKALKNISLPNLSLLNVDGTNLPCDPSPFLVGCPKLIHVSAKNLQPPPNLEADSESEL
uniref:UBX domain-containing protein 4 n=1 Tax=Strigamia maritima TaxID=126957 RepID=T1JEQ3_STRMM